MTDLVLSRHVEMRMRQRGLREADVAFLMEVATPLDGDALLLTDDDAQREIARRKREIAQIERLRGVKLVVTGETVVTVYHSGRRDQRQALRRKRASG